MAPKGRRTDLASLSAVTGEYSSVDGVRAVDKPVTVSQLPAPASLPLEQLVANPRNPREAMKVDDLASIAEIQLQPALVVTRGAYLGLWPEDEPQLGQATHVVINGCRRLLACTTYGRADLEIVVKDEVAATKVSLRAAAIRENVERENLDVLEEAQAVEDLVSDCGGVANDAAVALGKSKTWVSQRRNLLKLVPELKEKLRAGELAIRDARQLGSVPTQEQVARWQAQLAKQFSDEPAPEDKPKPPKQGASHIARALKRWDAGVPTLASALVSYLDPARTTELIDELHRLASDTKS